MDTPQYIKAKSILSRLKQAPDPYFGTTYSMNLYRGCQHGCIYCDSRSHVYQLESLDNIRIKSNALELLNTELGKKTKKATISTGSMNDPYMPLEQKVQLTRKALSIISQYNFPVHIITKSNLVYRDIDILQHISKTYCAVTFTITTPNDHLARKIEPNAPSPSKRFEAMSQLASANIYTGVVITPVLPFITDNVDELTQLVHRVKEAGGKYVLFYPSVTLRNGSREYFYQQLDTQFTGLSKKYRQTFGDAYECKSVNSKNIFDTLTQICQQKDLSTKINFYEDNLPVQGTLF